MPASQFIHISVQKGLERNTYWKILFKCI